MAVLPSYTLVTLAAVAVSDFCVTATLPTTASALLKLALVSVTLVAPTW